MWDGRREAGQWSSWAQPAAVVVRESLWLLVGLLTVWKAYHGTFGWVLTGFVVAVVGIGLRRDLRGPDRTN